jgi:hypothetical protein
MADDTRQPDDGSPDAPQEFEQLTLDPTVTGPGMRTEDPFEPGTELKIEGQRGTFRYRYATVSRSGAISLHLVRDGMFRAVRPDQVSPLNKGLRDRLYSAAKRGEEP